MARFKKNKPSAATARQTGPRTAQGKAISSQNSTTHGCRSLKHRILEGESETDFFALRARWFDEYGPVRDLDIELLERVVEAHWRMLRNERQLTETEAAIQAAKSLLEWTDSDHKLIQLARRYYREALRFYNAARRDLDDMRLTRQREIKAVDTAGKAIESIAVRRHTQQRLAEEAKKTSIPASPSGQTSAQIPAADGEMNHDMHAEDLRDSIPTDDNKQRLL